MAIVVVRSLDDVAQQRSKKASEDVLRHVREVVDARVRDIGSQVKAAKLWGMTQGNISAILTSNRGIGVPTVVALCRGLRMSADELLMLVPAGSSPGLPISSMHGWAEAERAARRRYAYLASAIENAGRATLPPGDLRVTPEAIKLIAEAIEQMRTATTLPPDTTTSDDAEEREARTLIEPSRASGRRKTAK